jgi:hypothetical protein
LYRVNQLRRPFAAETTETRIVASPRAILAASSQRGGSRLKLIIFLAILFAAIYVSVKVVPILVDNMQFQDGIESVARFASVNHQNADDIRTAVLKEAQNEDIPITAEEIRVKGESGHVEIAADYSVTVNLGVYQWTLNFHPYAKNNPIM